MCEFHYNYIKSKFNVIYYLQTDSFIYEIETEDVYEDFYEDKNLSDFSDSPQDSKFFDPANKKVISNMKDEFKEKNSEFVVLKSKMYSLIAVDGGENENVVKKIRHKKYINVLFNKKNDKT